MAGDWIERNIVNRGMRTLVLLGRDIDGVRILEVKGRRTGRPRRAPVKLLEVDSERYVVSLRGESDWVRNLRQDPRAHILFGRESVAVNAVELPPNQRSPIVQAYLAAATRNETRRALAQDLAELPVFRLDAA